MNNIWKASLGQAIQSGMTTVLGLLKSGKLVLGHTSDRGDLMKLLGQRHEKFDLVPLTKKPFMMEPRHSVVNEVIPRDRSGRPDCINSHEEAWPQQFVIGNDETELELSVEFVNRVNDQVRKRQKNLQCYRRWRRTFYDLECLWL